MPADDKIRPPAPFCAVSIFLLSCFSLLGNGDDTIEGDEEGDDVGVRGVGREWL